ncbi:UDP-2,3-diacylglucosamine diphosphatase [Vibrio sp. 10N.261.55.A7]|uniref:UDP-2,3-diacylglucosamine diphosphatase n=1 Tax=Vibrio sp. 10N.261.55.A7 TaxID=1880851 RepID=UPI000C85777C|nr:UDP-2,3-diacylglucosamine diphosphatase [Vibrio sp. 10N.261.55.A7]PMJ93446.1 UDP-2,3-diacylglucosamine diphosphatase [Vibrio sp. 10N.261.55.A7]
MTTLFISDLHLSPSRPDITQCFVDFMRNEAIHAKRLYVLGDLFEFWVGDDDNTEFSLHIQQEFQRLTQLGVQCYFTQGNRDFLVGKRFAKNTGMTLLQDETVIELYGRKAVVLHGDTLCTRDVKYLEYRKKVHQPWLQWVFNRIPFSIKKKIVSKVQSDIKEDKETKSLDIMDVTPDEVVSVMNRHDVNLMIHGHTHRPNIHQVNVNSGDGTRIVLGDWYTQGSILVYDNNGFELKTKPFTSD